MATGSEISRSEGISAKYLEGILGQLKAAGLVQSERGKKGGYRLSRSPSTIAILEVVRSLEGEVRPVDCLEDSGKCAMGSGCQPRLLWIGLKEAIDGYLASRTLEDIIGG